MQQMNGGAAVGAEQLGLVGGGRGFGQDRVVVDHGALAENVVAQIDGDDDTGAERAAHRHRDGIDQGAVDQPAAVDLHGLEDARQRERGL